MTGSHNITVFSENNNSSGLNKYVFFLSGIETLFSVIILKYSDKKEPSPVTDTDHISYTGSEDV